MDTGLVNPAATQGADYGGILSNILGAYTQISLARVNRETAKYNAAATIQQQTFNPPQAGTMLEALGIGNATIPGTNANGVARSGGSGVGQLLVLGVAGVAGFFLIKKLAK